MKITHDYRALWEAQAQQLAAVLAELDEVRQQRDTLAHRLAVLAHQHLGLKYPSKAA